MLQLRMEEFLAWIIKREKPVVIDSPSDLYKVGINSPDWTLLKVDHLVLQEYEADTIGPTQ